MEFFLLLLVFCFILFLFCVYILSNDDFVFLRKNVTTEQVFDVAFLASVVGLLVSRLVYVVFHFSVGFLNPLVFFLFPYFSGLSLLGGILGASLFTFFYTKSKKLPSSRIVDFFSLAALCAIQFGIFFQTLFYFLAKHKVDGVALVITILYVAMFLFFVAFLLPFHRSGELKEGTLSILFFIAFSVLTVISDLTLQSAKVFGLLGYEGIIGILVFIISIVLLIRQERLIVKLQKRLF